MMHFQFQFQINQIKIAIQNQKHLDKFGTVISVVESATAISAFDP